MGGCMQWDYDTPAGDITAREGDLFIINEGNFQYGNATLGIYDPTTAAVTHEAFIRANGMRLGDVAQSMTINGDKAWIVVNNSHVVFALDRFTLQERGRIENLTSPRYIYFVNDRKAYITQLWDNRIFIVDPRRYTVTGYITVEGMTPATGSTEQILPWGDDVIVNCWSYNNRIIKIDTATDRITASLEVGMQPRSMAIDNRGKLWVLTDGAPDGGYNGSIDSATDGTSAAAEGPALVCIDCETFTIERRMRFKSDDAPSSLTTNTAGDTLYWLNKGVYRAAVTMQSLPAEAFIPPRGTRYYGLTIQPSTGDIYVADAIDYQQSGTVYIHNSRGIETGSFKTGINPGAFTWNTDPTSLTLSADPPSASNTTL